ncbi:MAG: hypothetical protein FWC57_04855 [Endomicrobia bacterium]|nr:hypothetical protein [Endomicrobiia bacterium]
MKVPDKESEKTLLIDDDIKKIAKKSKVFTNPFVIIAIAIAVAIGAIFAFVHFFDKKEKKLLDFIGNVSGIALDIRTPKRDRMAQILAEPQGISRTVLLRDTVNDKDKYTEPLEGVNVKIDKRGGANVFVGVSTYVPIEIKLPPGEYTMNLEYPRYGILEPNKVPDEDKRSYLVVNYVNMTLELSGTLTNKTVIMVDEKMGE